MPASPTPRPDDEKSEGLRLPERPLSLTEGMLSYTSLRDGNSPDRQTRRIDQDRKQFKQIVRGQVRKNLRKYMSHGEMIGRQGKDLVSIPIPQLDVPDFRFGKNGSGGVGKGDGDVGDPLGKPGDGDSGSGGAGGEAGSGHLLEVDVTLEELAQIMQEEMKLPNLKPKGADSIIEERDRYNSKRRVGPRSLRIFKDTYTRALRREISSGNYNPKSPIVVPTPEDEVMRAAKPVPKPEISAAVIYMMDVSGSMTDEQKRIVRQEAFWLDTWIGSQYDGIEKRYIIHDAVAKVVDEHTFYHTRESGGTRVSSAYRCAKELIAREFPTDQYNLYIFQFTDGDNFGDDNKRAKEILENDLLPVVNLFGYTQVESPYGSGDFLKFLDTNFSGNDVVVSTEVESADDIYDSIKKMLGGAA